MFAVDSKFFDDGRVTFKIRAAVLGERARCEEREFCDVYTDVFETRAEAEYFCKEGA